MSPPRGESWIASDPQSRESEADGLKGSLRLRLTLTYLGLAIVPVVLVAALVGQRAMTELNEQSRALQRAIATRVAHELAALVDSRFQELRAFVLGSGLSRLDARAQKTALDKLLAYDHLYQEVALVDQAGRVRVRLSRTRVFLPEPAEPPLRGPEVTAPIELGEDYFGGVRFSATVREPLATISIPVLDRRSGERVFALVASLRLVRIRDALGQTDLPHEVDVFVLDPEGRVIAHRNPAMVLAGTRLPVPTQDGTIRIDARDHLAVTATVERAGQQLIVLAVRPLSTAYAPATRALTVTTAVALAATLIAGLLVVLTVRHVVKPIETLVEASRRVGAGNLDFEPDAGGPAELRVLAGAFAQMLRDLRESLRTAREAQQRSMRQEKLAALGQMAGELGHELRNPLGALANSAAVLDASVPASDARCHRSVKRIIDQVHRMSRLTDDLLSFARTRECEKTEFAIESVLGKTIENRPPPENVVVHRPSPGVESAVVADRVHAAQILDNLVVNAYEAMPEGGELAVRVTVDQGLVRCALDDTGDGIRPDAIERVFEPLYTTKPKGVGLGLAICKNLAEINGGSLTASSVEGEGTTFELVLPAVVRSARGPG